MATSKPAIKHLFLDISFGDSFGQEPLSRLLPEALSRLAFLLVARFLEKNIAPGWPRNDDHELGRPTTIPAVAPFCTHSGVPVLFYLSSIAFDKHEPSACKKNSVPLA